MDEFRTKGGTKAAIVGIGSNTFLTIFNIGIGIISGSYALISEGAHTLSDVATSIIAYLGFRIGQKPADEEHPLGHGRAEAIAGLIIVLFLTMVAYEIMTGAINKIVHPELITTPSYLAAVMALIGIGVNLCISRYIIALGKKIRSPAIVADGNHQKVDIFSSVAILVGVFASNSGYSIIDPVIGLIIGLFVLKTAYTIGKENIDNIMGKIPSKELIKDIEKAVQSPADYILLDQGSGGTGKTFDWSLIPEIERPFFLAGGIGALNMKQAICEIRPYAVDLSSSVETEKWKDPKKIRQVVDIVRRI